MILQSLYLYYNRIMDDPESGIAPPGFTPQKISYALILDRQGNLVGVQDIRDVSGRKPRPVQLLVPEGVIRSSAVKANFLWDNTGYVLGFDNKGKPERTRETFEAFKALQHHIGDEIDDPGMKAVLRFIDIWDPQDRPGSFEWDELVGLNLVFRLENEKMYVHEHPTIIDAWRKYQKASSNSGMRGTCLVTGNCEPIPASHTKIKNVRGAQTSGAALVSFNLDTSRSFGKTQNYNAPIGEEVAFAYTTALNHLLDFESRQKLLIGDITIVFWTERSSVVEDFMGNILDPWSNAVNDADQAKIETYLKDVRAGKKPEAVEDNTMHFYIIGLSPNASRLAIEFWYADTVETVNKNVGLHFKDLELVRQYDDQREFPGIRQLVIETARRYKRGQKPIDGDVNPLLSSAFLRSILEGMPYPNYLLASLVNRIRADGEINYYRTAMMKAFLRRNYKNKEATMALNEESTNVAYRLGRLFAVLEKAQEEAVPGANATIKDRFYGSASSTPRVVFPQLLRLSQHHLAKIDGGAKVYKEKLMQSILDGIDGAKGIPPHLPLEDQGMFALGYYHQRKAFFTSKPTKE